MSYLPFGGVTIDGEVTVTPENHQFDYIIYICRQ